MWYTDHVNIYLYEERLRRIPETAVNASVYLDGGAPDEPLAMCLAQGVRILVTIVDKDWSSIGGFRSLWLNNQRLINT